MKNFNGALLEEEIYNTFISIRVNEESARNAAKSMVQTSLRGVDSHGINLFPHYFSSYQTGRLNKNPEFKFEQHKSSVLILDANHAIGHHAGIVAINKCVEVAKNTGISACTVKNSSHYGASSYFGLHAANQGFIGLSFTNADALVKAYNGKESFFGTNPICFCAPMKGEEPFCLDMATSLVSWNKIKNYRRTNTSIPEHWAFNKEGQSVTDPHLAASLSPIGDYKGFGLGMIVEIVCALLSGSVIGKDMLAMFTSPPEAQRQVSHFFMVLDINAFINKDIFESMLSDMASRIRNLEPLNLDKVMIPGDPEKQTFEMRVKAGIPCIDEVIDEFVRINPSFAKCLIE